MLEAEPSFRNLMSCSVTYSSSPRFLNRGQNPETLTEDILRRNSEHGPLEKLYPGFAIQRASLGGSPGCVWVCDRPEMVAGTAAQAEVRVRPAALSHSSPRSLSPTPCSRCPALCSLPSLRDTPRKASCTWELWEPPRSSPTLAAWWTMPRASCLSSLTVTRSRAAYTNAGTSSR